MDSTDPVSASLLNVSCLVTRLSGVVSFVYGVCETSTAAVCSCERWAFEAITRGPMGGRKIDRRLVRGLEANVSRRDLSD